MRSNITSLSFDIIHSIAGSLDVRSFVNLARSNRHFHQLLQDEATARRCLQASIPYSRSLHQTCASLQKRLNQTLLLKAYDRSEALRTGTPFSVSILAYATSFQYNQGVLVYSNGHDVRVMDIHGSARLERIVTHQAFTAKLHKNSELPAGSSDLHDRLSILQYCEGVAVVLYESDRVTGSWLFAVDVRESRGPRGRESRSRFLLVHRLTSVKKLFVRHNASYLYLGTCSVLDAQGHHEWLIHGFDLAIGIPVTTKPIQLFNFVGTEVGSTAAFAIHGDCFYAVSNQTSHESEEIDWTSYYNCICFALFDPKPDTRIRHIYRRQHREGPINDAWNNLSLQIDEETNDLLIVEGRKEWLGGGSTNIRTYYTEKFELSQDVALEGHPTYPPNDPLVRTIDSCNKPRYEETRPRAPRHVHSDYTGDPKYEFIRAKTKYHAYQGTNNSFIDLVTENIRVPGSCRPRECILLRVASRIPKSPLEPDPIKSGAFRLREPLPDKKGSVLEDSEQDFQPTQVQLWPPSDAPQELLDILCPGGRAGDVSAVSDDRAIIYTAGPRQADSNGGRAIVMINFDPSWGFEWMRRWPRNETETVKAEAKAVQLDLVELAKKTEAAVLFRLKRKNERDSSTTGTSHIPDWSSGSEGERAPKKHKYEMCSPTTVADSAGKSSSPGRPRYLWMEEARYLSIKQGFWLR